MDFLLPQPDEWRTIIDFGLLVLIWLVQLIIYPGFQFIQADALPRWHKNYMFNISILVIPLMLAQVLLVMYQLYATPNAAVYLSAFLIPWIWLSTFFQVVPIHNALTAGLDTASNMQQLVAKNKVRTVLWTIVFGLGLYRG